MFTFRSMSLPPVVFVGGALVSAIFVNCSHEFSLKKLCSIIRFVMIII